MKHIALHWSRPIEITHGEGCHLFGPKGERYLDFAAGWCVGNIGWGRADVREALVKEAERGTYIPPFLLFSPWDDFAKMLCDIAPGNRLQRVFPCASGSEAVEFAIKCARAATGKEKIVSIDEVYHGHTYGAASLGRNNGAAIAPYVPGFLKLPMPHALHGVRAEDVLEKFAQMVEADAGIAAFMTEPVWSNAGSIVPPAAFLPEIEKLCRQHGVLFIMDEVATGFGRCGKLFASELWNLSPDILCLAKGLTGGYATMGATLVSEEIFKKTEGIPSYSTFGWLQTDFAATKANVDVLLKEKLWENAKTVGKYLLAELKSLEDLPCVAEVRGIGLLLAIEIVRDASSSSPDYEKLSALCDACAAKGLIIEIAGSSLFLSPPLILTKELAAEGAAIIHEVFRSYGACPSPFVALCDGRASRAPRDPDGQDGEMGTLRGSE
jgi:4-aminobutyrate aminotransferase-like enzyme